MAGDHKCPVCQATFTRPQHVARHMRSHTGDRPYKCEYCGDQFARSDLLSRHVNKCHASEKPPTTTNPRRKGQGGASSTRATTSKQACDQCVVSALPCDGSNPCTKCVQRKIGCSYIKFQRQTAPSGPGHKHSQSVESTSSTSSNLAISIPHTDDLFLAPPPLQVPSMGTADLQYAAGGLQTQQPYHFDPSSNWDGATLDSPSSPSLTLSGSPADSADPPSPDLAARYRVNSDLLRRAAMMGHNIGAAVPGLFNATQSVAGQPELWPPQSDFTYQVDALNRGDEKTLPQRDGQQLLAQPYIQSGASFSNYPYQQPLNMENYSNLGNYNLHTRRSSVDQASDGSGGNSHSASNSAASSSAHLPLADLSTLDTYGAYSDPQQPPVSRDGRFSSSFGHLSLNDPAAVFGNMTTDSAPFFSGAAMKLPPSEATPRPMHDETSLARDRDAEMRELREFWKQYLRTPLTGPSLGTTPRAESGGHPFGSNGNSNVNGGAARPAPHRGLSRVASLPTVRPPSDEKNHEHHTRNGGYAEDDYACVRPTTHYDDLKSYEEAVMARKAPTTLNISPRRIRGPASTAGPHQDTDQPPTQSHESQPTVNHAQDEGATHAQSSGMRPSFKRLPSQTLGPPHSKRMLYRWTDDNMDDTDSEVEVTHEERDAAAAMFRTQVSQVLLDRYRRQGTPTIGRPMGAAGAGNPYPAPPGMGEGGGHPNGRDAAAVPIE